MRRIVWMISKRSIKDGESRICWCCRMFNFNTYILNSSLYAGIPPYKEFMFTLDTMLHAVNTSKTFTYNKK